MNTQSLMIVPMSISRAGNTVVVEVSTELFSPPEIYNVLFAEFAPFFIEGVKASIKLEINWGTPAQYVYFTYTFKFGLLDIDYIPITTARIAWLNERVAELHTQFKLALWRMYRAQKGYPDDALARTTFGQDT